jgi:putative membrane protein
MIEENNDKESKTISHARDHMANERTFLAWIRTSIGIMAFGFVVEKFTIFMKQISHLLGKSDSPPNPDAVHALQGYSSIFGVFLVGLGVLICLLAFIKYKNIEKQIETGSYHSSMLLYVMLTLFVFLIGVFLIIYLNNSI